jgi:hypothetical protein
MMFNWGAKSAELGSKPPGDISFAEWRIYFFIDAESHGLLGNAEELDDTALRLFWQRGIEPSVSAVLNGAVLNGVSEKR